MNDTFITVIAIFLTAVLLFVFPVLTMADKLDDASNAKVDTITSNFVSEIQMTGKLTLKDYNSFIEELASTGNTYDVNMEVKILDENPGKKASQTDKDKIGENVYYSIYTTQIEDILKNSDNNNQYTFKEGDLIKVTVKNTNLTLSQQMKNWLYTIAGNDTYTVSATESAMVATNGGDLVYTSEKSDGSDKNQAENENKLLYELRENNSSGRILKTGEWTNCNVWVKLWAEDDYKLDLEYYWKYENEKTYSRVEKREDGYILTIPNESSINVYWKHSTLEKYSNIETIDMRIERERPTIEEVIGSTKKGNSGTITINGINDTGGSGVYGYYISTSSETPDATSSSWVYDTSSSVRKPVEKNGTYYVWVKDKAGNISDRKSCTVSGIVPPVETVIISNKMVLKNGTVTFAPQFTGGTEYSKIEFTSSNTNIARVDNNGNATGINAGNTTIRCTVTNFNGTTCSAEATLRVVEVAYNPNGGTLDLPYNNGRFTTLSYNETTNIFGDTSVQEYAWSKSSASEPSSWTRYPSTNGGQATLTTSDVGTYYLWTRLTDVNGNKVTSVSNGYNVRKNKIDIINRYIGTNIYNIIRNPNTNGYVNQNVTLTVNLNVPDILREAVNGLIIQTNKNQANWNNTNVQTFTENGRCDIRLYDPDTGQDGIYSTYWITNIDKTTPSTPTISYPGYNNDCRWRNDISINLSSSDNVGIAYYQVDWNNDGSPDANIGANFVPWNGYSSHDNRFRAVDNAGNVSDWSSSVHIHMDTEAPTKTDWWWGEVNANVARLYIQASDNASGINRVQCPTSTASGGYNNWVWFNAVWDSSANAWRADITPSTFGHYGQEYQTHLYIYDNAGNGRFVDATSKYIPSNYIGFGEGKNYDYVKSTYELKATNNGKDVTEEAFTRKNTVIGGIQTGDASTSADGRFIFVQTEYFGGDTSIQLKLPKGDYKVTFGVTFAVGVYDCVTDVTPWSYIHMIQAGDIYSMSGKNLWGLTIEKYKQSSDDRIPAEFEFSLSESKMIYFTEATPGTGSYTRVTIILEKTK